MKNWGLYCFFLIGLMAGLYGMLRTHQELLIERTCQRVRQEFYRQDKTLQDWEVDCKASAASSARTCWNSGLKCLAQRLNKKLANLNSSHVYLSTPVETQQFSYHISLDTGLRARRVEGVIVVTEILSESPASRLDIRVGDIILAKNGYELRRPDEVQSPGTFTVERSGERSTLQVEGETIQQDMRPKLIELDRSAVVLRIPSFEGHYRGSPLFEKEAWAKISQELNHYSQVVVDLRGNYGGNFVAMLRALSPFFCNSHFVGVLTKDNEFANQPPEAFFPDQLDGEVHLALLINNDRVGLRTFEEYGCYRGATRVLVDAGTASVAEIFAEAMKARSNTEVWGQPTSGSVLVAKREELLDWGAGYILHVPISAYFSPTGVTIEGEGIYPQRLLFYSLKDATAGVDTWIQSTLAL